MNTHESYICVDDTFKGTTREVIEYLGFGTSSQISRCILEKRRFRGHKLEQIGIMKHVMFYSVFLEDQLIDVGSAVFLGEKYNVSPGSIARYADKGVKLLGKYTVDKIGISDVLEEL